MMYLSIKQISHTNVAVFMNTGVRRIPYQNKVVLEPPVGLGFMVYPPTKRGAKQGPSSGNYFKIVGQTISLKDF